MSAFRAGILDLDGVVVDSEALHLEATEIVFAKHGLALPGDGMEGYIGRTDFDIFTDAIARANDPGLDIRELLEAKNVVFGSITERMKTVPGALPFIQSMAASTLRLALATSSHRINQARAFDLFGLDRYFDAIVTADDVQHTKPDPEPYRLAVSRVDCEPPECFVIEDSFNGVRSAKAAGCHTIGLATSFPATRLLEAGADVTFETFDEIYQHINLKKAT
jgi:HAD superfamily hydrolase (TIGR01509 family)